MQFSKAITAGALLAALASLASPVNARAIDSQAVAHAHSKLSPKCKNAGAGACVDGPATSHESWSKRAIPKFAGDLDDLDSPGGVAVGGSGTGALDDATQSGGTIQSGGVNRGDSSDSDSAGGATVDRGDTSDSDTGGVAVGTKPPSPPHSEDGSTDTTASLGSHTTSDDQFPLGPANQPVVDIVARGYGSTANIVDPNTIVVTVTTPKVGGPLDILEVDTLKDSIGVKWAINDLDKIENNAGKVPLRSILADTWSSYGGVQSGKQMSDLKSVNYQIVVNEDMQAAFPLAYQAADREFIAGERAPMTVTADSIPGSAYDVLMKTTFGAGATKMLGETAGLEGRTIYSIDLFPTDKIDVQFNF